MYYIHIAAMCYSHIPVISLQCQYADNSTIVPVTHISKYVARKTNDWDLVEPHLAPNHDGEAWNNGETVKQSSLDELGWNLKLFKSEDMRNL